jgi:hypothetical protein
MSPKGFAVLAAATALSLGLAAWAVTARDVPLAASRQAEPMFAGLLDRLNDVQTIKVTGSGQTLTMTRTADGKWQLAERGGYPADYKKARELALGLASLQLVEAKTGKADRLARRWPRLLSARPSTASMAAGARASMSAAAAKTRLGWRRASSAYPPARPMWLAATSSTSRRTRSAG